MSPYIWFAHTIIDAHPTNPTLRSGSELPILATRALRNAAVGKASHQPAKPRKPVNASVPSTLLCGMYCQSSMNRAIEYLFDTSMYLCPQPVPATVPACRAVSMRPRFSTLRAFVDLSSCVETD